MRWRRAQIWVDDLQARSSFISNFWVLDEDEDEDEGEYEGEGEGDKTLKILI